MPSEAARKIGLEWAARRRLSEQTLHDLAEFLDSMGVGDAFECCEAIDDEYANNRGSAKAQHAASQALRKAGLV